MAPVDPQAQALLDQMAAPGGSEPGELSVAQAREAYKGLAQLSGESLPVKKVEDRRVPGPGAEIPVRVYTPFGAPGDAAPARTAPGTVRAPVHPRGQAGPRRGSRDPSRTPLRTA